VKPEAPCSAFRRQTLQCRELRIQRQRRRPKGGLQGASTRPLERCSYAISRSDSADNKVQQTAKSS
jgi:hypothetical protein